MEFEISKCQRDLENNVKFNKSYQLFTPFPLMYRCKFGQNLFTCSGDNIGNEATPALTGSAPKNQYVPYLRLGTLICKLFLVQINDLFEHK